MRTSKAVTFIRTLWRNQPGKYFYLASKVGDKWDEKCFSRRELSKVEAYLDEHSNGNLYMCPHGFSRKRRHKSTAMDPHMAYADLDDVDIHSLSLKPTIALETSPGRYAAYWLTDSPVGEDLNQRLSYMLNADRSGWDRTQVLRIPHTRNYKYKKKPLVRVLWNNGPRYETERLERMVPQIDKGRGVVGGDAAEIFKEYEKGLSRWARKELMNGKPQRGKRSEVLWKLNAELLEAGASRDDAFTLLWHSAWNKFASRRDGQAQLQREIDKAIDTHVVGNRVNGHDLKEEEKRTGRRFLTTPMSEIVAEDIDWIVHGWFARKEMTIVEGDPGTQKSYFMQMVSAQLCDGKAVMSERPIKPPRRLRVAYFDTENTPSSVTKKRLDWNGFVHQENFIQEPLGISVDDDEAWEDMLDSIEEFGPDIVVFDPINIYIGGADTHKASETQQALQRFREIATEFNCAVVLIRHLNKNSKDKALYRGQGSIAIAGSARIVLAVGRSPEDDDVRVVTCSKMNLTRVPKAVSYQVVSSDDRDDYDRSVFEWGELCEFTADDVLSAAIRPKNNDREVAREWLKEILSDGAHDATSVKRMANARGISTTTLYRAVDALGIMKKQKGYGKHKAAYWELPE